MDIKTTQYSEITVSTEELEAIVASFVKAQLPDQEILEVKLVSTNEEGGNVIAEVKTEPATSENRGIIK